MVRTYTKVLLSKSPAKRSIHLRLARYMMRHRRTQRYPGANRVTLELLRELRRVPTDYQESLVDSGLIDTNINLDSSRMADSIAGLPWVSDGIAGDERIAVNFLALLDQLNPTAAARILAMPFPGNVWAGRRPKPSGRWPVWQMMNRKMTTPL